MQNDCSNCNLNEISKDHENRIAKLEMGQAVTDEKINNILSLVQRIDKKLEEPDPFKAWLMELAKHIITIGVIGGVAYALAQNLL